MSILQPVVRDAGKSIEVCLLVPGLKKNIFSCNADVDVASWKDILSVNVFLRNSSGNVQATYRSQAPYCGPISHHTLKLSNGKVVVNLIKADSSNWSAHLHEIFPPP